MGKSEYTATYIRDGKWLVAWVNEVSGAITQGRTLAELRENLQDVLALVLEDYDTSVGKINAGSRMRFNISLRRGHEAIEAH